MPNSPTNAPQQPHDGGVSLRVNFPDFHSMITSNDYFFCDHSEALSVFLEHNHNVHLLTCPRRFGKTTLCRMFAEFCDIEKADSNPELFAGLIIAQRQAFLEKHMSQYPLLHVSFKDTFGATFADFTASLKIMLKRVVTRHPALQNTSLPAEQTLFLDQCRNLELADESLEDALENLLNCLYLHYGNRGVILILDEYDKPFHKTFYQNKAAHHRIVSFMERFFGHALKDNTQLERAFLTGVLRIPLGNVMDFSVTDTDNPYQHYLGFPPETVQELISRLGYPQPLFDAVTTWYDGYCIGSTPHRYNPWSVMSCLSQGGHLRPHWVRSGDTQLLEYAIASQQDPLIHRQLRALISHQEQEVLPASHFTFDELTSRRAAIWSLLLQSGYLTVTRPSTDSLLTVKIPNHEVWLCFKTMIEHWLGEEGMTRLPAIVETLQRGDVQAFSETLSDYLQEAACYRDKLTSGETYYHVLMLGMLIHAKDTFHVQSEPVSGFGHPDLVLTATTPNAPSYIIELKQASSSEQLETQAQAAFQQILSKDYAARYKTTSDLVGIGLAFWGHQVACHHDRLDKS